MPTKATVMSSSSYSSSFGSQGWKFGSSEGSWKWLQLVHCAYLQSHPGYFERRSERVSGMCQNGDMYQNGSEYKSEDERNGGSEFMWFGGAQNARNRIILAEESSRMRRIRVGFDIQNVETYMTLGTYILDGNESGMHEERRQYSEGT